MIVTLLLVVIVLQMVVIVRAARIVRHYSGHFDRLHEAMRTVETRSKHPHYLHGPVK